MVLVSVVRSILFVLPHLNAGGAEKVAINYLRQLDPVEYNVILVVFQETPDLRRLVPDFVNVIDLKTVSTRKSFLPLITLFWKLRPDVVFSTHSRIASLLLLVKPFIPSFYHLARMQSTPSLEKKNAVYGSLRRMIYAAGFRSANVVIAQTEAMKEDGIALFGLEPSNVKVLLNPLDTTTIQRNIVGISSPFPKGEVAAVASGRLAYPKAFDVLISALPRVLNVYPGFVLYILGADNGEGEKLKALVRRLGLDKHVEFLGFQENPYRFYAFCDIFILSSRWEGFPNVLLENYYLCTPVVATRCVPVVQDLVIDGYNGYSCAVNDEEGLSRAIIDCLGIKRSSIVNAPYSGGLIESVL